MADHMQTTADCDAPPHDTASPPNPSKHNSEQSTPSETVITSMTTGSTQQHGSSLRRSPRLQEAKPRAASPTPPSTASSSKSSLQLSPTTSTASKSTTSASATPSSTSTTPLTRNTARILFPDAHSGSKTPTSTPAETPFSDPKPGANPVPTQTKPKQQRTKSAPSSTKSHTTRPDAGPRAATDPTPILTPSSTPCAIQSIDCGIENQLKNPRPLSKKNLPQGYVYIIPFTHKEIRGIKTGYTTETCVNTRINKIKAQCGEFIDCLQPSREHRLVRLYYEQVEQLALKELGNFLYEFKCCGTKHREYLTVDEEVGHMVVERWARFCEEVRPYGEDFLLKAEWEFHLDRFKGRNHGRAKEGGERIDDHVGRGKRWEEFFRPRKEDWFKHRAGVWKNKVRENGWQCWSLLLAALLVRSTFSCWASLLLGLTAWFIQREKEEFLQCVVVEVGHLLIDVIVRYFWPFLSLLGKLVSLVYRMRHVQGGAIAGSGEGITTDDSNDTVESVGSIKEGDKDMNRNGEEENEEMEEREEGVEAQGETEDEDLEGEEQEESGEGQAEGEELEREEDLQEEITCAGSVVS